MRVTIYHIAREANVGIGTVSRVFNNHPSVSEKTKQRVLRVASRLNYHPHPYARGLARKRTNSILAVIPFFTTFFFVEVLRGVQAKLSELDCDLILYGVNHPDQVGNSVRRNAVRGRVDGILFFSMKPPLELLEQYLSQKIPIVLVDTYHEKFDSLFVENVSAASVAAKHLISLGHKRIGMLNASLESVPARERLEGFRSALAEEGISVDPNYVRTAKSSTLDGFTREAGFELMKEFIAMRTSMPTALFVSSDIQAAGALQALSEAGLRCPDDIAIVSFDDIELASHLQLTTMRQPMRAMGSLAVDMLFERIKNPQAEPKHTKFTPELIIRKSCGAHQAANSTRVRMGTGNLS